LEYSCHAGYFFSVVTVQWVCLLAARTKRLSIFQKGFGSNGFVPFAILFETLLAFLLIYIPGINSGLQMGPLNPVSWFPQLAFIVLAFFYDEIRKAIIRKHPGSWTERMTCY